MENTQIKKPLSVRRREIIEILEKEIINSGLDLYLIEPILADALSTVRDALALREVNEKQAYLEKLQDQKEG